RQSLLLACKATTVAYVYVNVNCAGPGSGCVDRRVAMSGGAGGRSRARRSRCRKGSTNCAAISLYAPALGETRENPAPKLWIFAPTPRRPNEFGPTNHALRPIRTRRHRGGAAE